MISSIYQRMHTHITGDQYHLRLMIFFYVVRFPVRKITQGQRQANNIII